MSALTSKSDASLRDAIKRRWRTCLFCGRSMLGVFAELEEHWKDRCLGKK